MDNGSSTPPPHFPQSETDSGSMGGSSTSTPPQLPPSEAESQSMDGSSSTSTPPQLPPSEAESRRSMGGSSTNTPPHLIPSSSINQQQPLLSQPSANLNLLQEVELMQLPTLGLGLELDRTPEFLAEIQAELDASKIPVTSISIGPTWRKESLREDDLTLKLYSTMKKLIWEFIEGPLKEKIVVSWSDITAIQIRAPDDDQPGVFRIQVGNKPLFFRKSPPQPMRFTGGWEPTSDFTVVGDALYHRIHEAEFAHQGVVHELHSALLLSDRRLLELTMYPFPAYPTQGDQSAPSSSTAAGLPSMTFTGVGVGESSSHMQMQGESSSSRNGGHNNDQPMPDQENIEAHDQAAPINGLSTLGGSKDIDADDQQQ